VVARGIRNTIGMGFHPDTGDFYFSENGIDDPQNLNESFSADEMNRIAAAEIGNAFDFGFPGGYVRYRTGLAVGGGVQPLHVFQPLGDPLTGSESEGATNIAFSGAHFPAPLRQGIFVGFSGEAGFGLANGENPVVYLDLATGNHYHLISNDDPVVGHIVGLVSTANSLFLTDYEGANGGTVYQISFVPEPSTWWLLSGALALLARRAGFRR
jgi:glucose/arabinose dehydrogenase